jgi:hypothetical protein
MMWMQSRAVFRGVEWRCHVCLSPNMAATTMGKPTC